MKTLNRTLSLVLVLVMVLGFFGVAGAAFKDQGDVTHKEAVEVMTGIGAIDGYADGSFNPKGNITREEAAKLVAYSILGKSVAEKLTVGNTGFKDIAADRWSAPYISYLVGEGVINGMGDGTFAPTANVTGYQMAKMMLVAAGYGAKGEFTGNGWDLAVAVTGNKAGVFSGSKGVDYAKPATREEATLYAFNTVVSAPQVVYNKLFDKYENVIDTSAAPNTPDYNVLTIAEQVYPTLQNPGTTINGVFGYTWRYKGVTISGFVADATVLAKSTDGTTYTALTTTNNKAYIGYTPDASDVSFYINGVANGLNTTAPSNLATFNAAAAKRGAVVTFNDINSDGKYDIVSISEPAKGEIAGDIITTTSGTVTYVTVPGIPELYKVNANNVFGLEGLKKDDIVLWHTDGTRFFLTKCDSFTGTAVAHNDTAGIAVINGKQYKMSGLTGAATLADVAATEGLADTTFYLDEGGFIIEVAAKDAAVTAANTLFVKATSYAGFTGTAMAVFSDGKVSPITVAKVNNASPVDANTDGVIDNVTAKRFYTFTKNENGSYNLTSVDSAKQTNIITYTDNTAARKVITKGAAAFLKNDSDAVVAGLYGTASTVFVYADSVVRTFTGISNAPSYDKDVVNGDGVQTVVAVLQNASGYAQFVVAYGGTIDGATTASSHAFMIGPATTIYGPNGTSYDQHYAVLNGDPTKTIDTTLGLGLQMGGLYAITGYDDTKVAAASGAQGLIHAFGSDGTGRALAGIADFKVSGNTVIALDTDGTTVLSSFIMAADAKVFTYDITDPTDPKIMPSTLSVINTLVGETYTIQGLQKSASDATITELYVTIQSGDAAGLLGAKYQKNVASFTGVLTNVTGAALANGATLFDSGTFTDTNKTYVILAVPYGTTVTHALAGGAVGNAAVVDVTSTIKAAVTGAGGTWDTTLYKCVAFEITDGVTPGVNNVVFTITSADGQSSSTHTVTATSVS